MSRERWFIAERPITTRDADAFSHDTIAKVLADSIYQAVRDFEGEPGAATIGLIGGFGTGKTSVVNLATDRLRSDLDINVVHVSADKHSGHARSRNIVHSIAGELVDGNLLKDHEVNEHLQRLRTSVSLAAPAPDEMRIAKWFSDPKGQSLRDVWSVLAIGGSVFVVMLILASLAGGSVATVLETLGSLSILGSIFAVGYRQIVGSLFEIPKRSTSRPRADAADDVQQVFANLINKYAKKNGDKPLVIFVDDIDRLGTADVLDAMRAIKSLQAVPRRKEPTFVVSCDDEIILAALKDQAATDDQAEAIDRTAGIASSTPEATARAYLDKFFSLRVPMPPHVRDDMPTFVQRLVPADHPLHQPQHIGSPEVVEATLLVLARGEVNSPRHLVHRVNGFLAAYRIASDRESASSKLRLHPGDATGRPILLARLSVIAADFRWFHEFLLRDEALLGAADRLARHEELSPTDRELLTTYGLAIPDPALKNVAGDDGERTSDDGPVNLIWNQQYDSLRTYLVGTFLSVEKSGESIVPLLYLAEPEGGRVLGIAKVDALVSAVRNGDTVRVTEALTELPPEHGRVAADQIREAVVAATRAELPSSLTGAVASLPVLESDAAVVATAVADRLPDIPSDTLSEAAYHDLLDAIPDSHRSGVLRSFATIKDGTSEEARNARALSIADYLANDPNAPHLAATVRAHLDRLPEHAGWAESHDWVEVALRLDNSVHTDLLADHAVPAMFRLARTDSSVEFDETAEGLVKLVENLGDDQRADLGPILRTIIPPTEGAAQMLLATYELIGELGHADDALRVAEAISFDLDDSVTEHGVALLGRSVATWKSATFEKQDDADGDEEVRYYSDAIGAGLASVVSTDPGPLVSARISLYASDLAASSPAFLRLLEASASAVEETEESSPVSDTLAQVVGSLLTAPVEDDAIDEQADALARVLAPLAETGDLSPKAKSLLAIVGKVGRSKTHRSSLDSETTRWTDSLKTNETPYLRERQISAFRALADAAPEAAQSAVAPVLATLQSWLPNSSENGHLRALAALPWGEELETALTLVAQKVDEFSTFDEIVPILRRAVKRGLDIPDHLLERFVKHVEADPIQQMPIANEIWSAFDVTQQARMLLAGLAGSTTAAELIEKAASDTFSALVIRAVASDRVSSLAAATDLGERSDEILGALATLVETEQDVSKGDFLQLIDSVDQSEVADELVARLSEISGVARVALKLLGHLDAGIVDGVIGRIDAAAAERLQDWDESVADVLADVRGNRPVSGALDDVVDEMLGADDESRAKALKLKPNRRKKRSSPDSGGGL